MLNRPPAASPGRSGANGLPFAIDDPAFAQIVRGEFYPHPVARHNADKVLPHASRDVCHHEVTAFDFDTKAGIGQRLNDDPLDFKSFFFLLCHGEYTRVG